MFFLINVRAQIDNPSNAYFAFKANVGIFNDNDKKRFNHGNPNYDALEKSYSAHDILTNKRYTQVEIKPFILLVQKLIVIFIAIVFLTLISAYRIHTIKRIIFLNLTLIRSKILL